MPVRRSVWVVPEKEIVLEAVEDEMSGDLPGLRSSGPLEHEGFVDDQVDRLP